MNEFQLNFCTIFNQKNIDLLFLLLPADNSIVIKEINLIVLGKVRNMCLLRLGFIKSVINYYSLAEL